MKYGFIGCGNMGSAIVRALSLNTNDIMITDRSGKAASLARELGCIYGDNETVVNTCQRILLAVKPQMMADVLKPLQSILQARKPLLISMAAGLTISRIEEMAGTSLPVVRIMPNTPVAVGRGLTLYCRNSLVDDALLADFLTDVAPCGRWDMLCEELIDAAGVISGCGPAYMYMFMDALAKGAESCGVPLDKALSYAADTMTGAAEMIRQNKGTPEALRNAVCSPGGSTIAGVRVLEENGFTEAVMECVKAAYKRNQELGK